jgi:hypothetical protein
MRLWIAGTVGLLVIGGTALAQGVAPIGGQFQVNAYTRKQQMQPQVAKDDQGDFVVSWLSIGSYGNDTGESIQARRFAANGQPKDVDFQVNTYTHAGQEWPDVAVGPQGDFVVVWKSTYSDGLDTSWSIQGQRFDASGSPVGIQFEVNSYTTGGQSHPEVARDPQGNFVVVWQSLGSYGPDTDWESIQAQRFDDTGTPVGAQFQVNSYTSQNQYPARVGVNEQGDFVVVWGSIGSYGTDLGKGWSIQAQLYENDGTPDGGQFQVNSYTTSHQKWPNIAVNAAGDFVVAWQGVGSDGTDTSSWSVHAQRFDATGAPQGGQFQVNTYTTGYQRYPEVGIDDQGAFVVVWESAGSNGTDTSEFSVQGQFYDAGGNPVGGEFQVNSYTSNKQTAPSVSAIDAEGNFVVVWDSWGSFGTDTWYQSVQGQRFNIRPVLVDNFESGDLSAWSNVVQ